MKTEIALLGVGMQGTFRENSP